MRNLAQSAALIEPRKGVFDDPPMRHQGEQWLYRLDSLPDHPAFRPLIKGTINRALIVEQ